MILNPRGSVLREPPKNELRIEHVRVAAANGTNALNDLSLTVSGGLCGVLGADGAGKTTLLRLLAVDHPAAHGRISFRGFDLHRQSERWRSLVGFLPRDFALVPAVPVCVAVEHYALLRGFTSAPERRSHVDAVLNDLELGSVRGHHVGELSPAESRRLGLAVALVGRPSLVLLDEPTVGLARDERTALLELMSRIASHALVLFTTSDPEDIGDWCTQLVALHQGRLLLDGAPDRLRDRVRGCVWSRSVAREQLASMRSLHKVVGMELTGDVATVRVICAQAPGVGFVSAEPKLSDVYRLSLPHGAAGLPPVARHTSR